MKSFTICLPLLRLRFAGEVFVIGGLCTFLRGRVFRRNDLISCDDNIAFSQIGGQDIPATSVVDMNLKPCFGVDVLLDLRGPVGQD